MKAEDTAKLQHCPLCFVKVEASQRYPRYVCRACKSRATALDGRFLEFFNESLSGGYLAMYKGTEEKYDSHICYIDGIECRADEARFGGIVIQPVEPPKSK